MHTKNNEKSWQNTPLTYIKCVADSWEQQYKVLSMSKVKKKKKKCKWSFSLTVCVIIEVKQIKSSLETYGQSSTSR